MNLLKILRIWLLFTLLVISVLLFGSPSYEMYMSKRIVFSDEKVDFDLKRPPAIVIAHIPLYPPYNQHKVDECKTTYNTSYDRTVECFDKKLSNLTDILQSERGHENQMTSSGDEKIFCNIMKIFFVDSWNLIFDQLYLGKKYTLTNYTLPTNEALSMRFQYKRVWVFLHDPDFFLQSWKDLVIPKCRFQINRGETMVVNIEAKYYELLDRPDSKCNNAEEYSFTTCIQVMKYLRIIENISCHI